VGDAGNAADPLTSFGAVTNKFNIGKFEITISQYATFLNSVAQSDPYGLYDGQMTSMPRIAGISRSGNSGSYTYQVIGPSGLTPVGASRPGDRPITFVSWFDAARFCNWLHNGATTGASTETGAYTLNGATTGVFTKTPNAKWWIPTRDEWYKAAYYKGGSTNSGYWLYPTQSDTPPAHFIGSEPNNANLLMAIGSGESSFSYVHTVTQSAGFSQTQNYLTEVGAFSGSPTYYGTFDQAGNVQEWNDAIFNNHSRGLRGGNWTWTSDFARATDSGGGRSPFLGEHDAGFRVATVASEITNIILTVEKTANLSDRWQFDREINVGPMTNTNEFYRLKIRTEVE
jgi:formylglycine-generating enzyme required for sulfatase activity